MPSRERAKTQGPGSKIGNTQPHLVIKSEMGSVGRTNLLGIGDVAHRIPAKVNTIRLNKVGHEQF